MSVAIPILLAAAFLVQEPQASIVGVVRDASTGAGVSGVEVSLPDLDRAVASDASGRYRLADVPAGPQHLTLRRIGYAARTVHALVPAGGELQLNFSLPVNPVPVDEVAVRSGIEMRGLSSPAVAPGADRVVTQAALRTHPMLAEPDALQALAGGNVVLDPEAPTGVHIRGGLGDQTAYLLDGIPVLSPYHAAGIFSTWNPEALAAVAVYSSMPPASFPDALSGTVAAFTREPGTRLRGQGAVSTGQARLTVDGPVGGAGYLLSLRSGFPNAFAPSGEPEYVTGESGDHLAKLELPGLGGRFDVLSFGSANELSASSGTAFPSSSASSVGNHFEWHSHSLGATWTRDVRSGSLRASAWRASSDARSAWESEMAPRTLDAHRVDEGVLVALATAQPTGDAAELGFRLERSRTSYRVSAGAVGEDGVELAASTPTATLFASISRDLGDALRADLGFNLSTEGTRLFYSPRARLTWTAREDLTVSTSYARSYQFAQSLRNDESLVGYAFPVDLFVSAERGSVPVARGDLGAATLDWTPRPGVRLGMQGFLRAMDDVLLVAPAEDGPFTDGSLATGSGRARGLSLEASIGSARYGLLASYGWQSVRLGDETTGYEPSYGTEHLIDTGGVFFPTATSMLRVSVTVGIGRRTSLSSGAFEWEACNLVDRGCEFVGAPSLTGRRGGRRLPTYVRVDLGVRKHWDVHVRGRDATIAAFGTVTNVFGRTNVLTEIADPATNELRRIDMRPLSPLVLGLDWRF